MAEGRTLIETINVFGGELTEVQIEKEEMELRNGRDVVRMKCLQAQDWPRWETVKAGEMIDCGKWEVKKMERIVDLISGATGTDIIRPQLMGILLQQQEDGRVMMVGTDGFRLAMVEEEGVWKPTKENGVMLVMVKDWQNVLSAGEIYEEKEWKVWRENERRWLVWRSESVEYWSSLLDEEKYPPWQKIVPLEFEQEIGFSGEEMRETLNKAQVFVKDGSNVVSWKVGEERIEVMAQGVIGQYRGEVELKKKNKKNIDLAFNLRYLGDFLGKVEDREVWMGMNGSVKPVMLRMKDDKSFGYIIMPFKQK